MDIKPTYEEQEKRVNELEEEATEHRGNLGTSVKY